MTGCYMALQNIASHTHAHACTHAHTHTHTVTMIYLTQATCNVIDSHDDIVHMIFQQRCDLQLQSSGESH